MIISYGQSGSLDLSGVSGSFGVLWFNPREGGSLQQGSVSGLKGGRVQTLGQSPADPELDWLVIIQNRPSE